MAIPDTVELTEVPLPTSINGVVKLGIFTIAIASLSVAVVAALGIRDRIVRSTTAQKAGGLIEQIPGFD